MVDGCGPSVRVPSLSDGTVFDFSGSVAKPTEMPNFPPLFIEKPPLYAVDAAAIEGCHIP